MNRNNVVVAGPRSEENEPGWLLLVTRRKEPKRRTRQKSKTDLGAQSGVSNSIAERSRHLRKPVQTRTLFVSNHF